MEANIISQTLRLFFINKLVAVDTPAGEFVGVLKETGRSLLLENSGGLILIYLWRSVKSNVRPPEDLLIRFCCDCPEATVHSIGSTLWVSCSLQDGWRPISSQCVLAEKRGRR